MSGTQKFVLAALALVAVIVGLVALTANNNSDEDKAVEDATTTTESDPAATDECYQETGGWVALIVDSNASEEVFLEMLQTVGQQSDRYKAIVRIYPQVSVEQFQNGADAASALLDELVREECGLPATGG